MIPSAQTMNEAPKRQAGGGLTGWLRRSLQTRLTFLVMVITIPLLIAITVFLTVQARRGLLSSANQTLAAASGSISETTRLWLDYNSNALRTLVSSPDIATMNTLWQKPMLKQMVASYPYMYLVSTTDVNGINRTRSDDQTPKDYSDRYWFTNALNGAPVTYETLIGRTSNNPALVVSIPIRELSGAPGSTSGVAPEGNIVGVGMFATELTQINSLVTGVSLGAGSSIMIVDQKNLLIASSDPNIRLMTDMSDYPAVKALRQGVTGAFNFADTRSSTSRRQRFQAYISALPNGWGVITQQTEAGLFGPINQFQRLTFAIVLLGSILMALLTISTIRRAVHPIQDLTQVAVAIRSGDLTRQAATQAGPVENQDEVGLLAHTFNQMTAELRELVGGLENRVAERTSQLERRALQFQVTSEVARDAAAIRDPERLLQNVVNRISEGFGFDHVGIFLLDLRTSAESPSESSQRMRAAPAPENRPGTQSCGRHLLRAASGCSPRVTA